MRTSKVLRKIRTGELTISGKSSFHHPEILELMCRYGFDAIWMCHEHRKIDPTIANNLIRICRLWDTDAIIRVSPNNYTDILWLLEAGVNGIMLPRVKSKEQILEVLEYMKFPPQGRRGYDGIGPDSDFGLEPASSYIESSNKETFLIVQIEEPEIIPYIDDIASMPGVDLLFVGPKDLTLNLGKFGQTKDSEVVGIIDQVAQACERHQKVAGIPCSTDKLFHFFSTGYRFFNVTSDFKCISDSLSKVQKDIASFGSSENASLTANP